MSEDNDYTPAPHYSKSHSTFNNAYDAYTRSTARTYSSAKSKGKTVVDLVLPSISTDAKVPIVVLVDGTGSMGKWPAKMFSKMPYLEHETHEYFGDDFEFAWGVIGDYISDTYWFGIRPFSKKEKIKENLEELVLEGNGGGDSHESYAHGALYCARNVEMPNATKPILIMIGDEGFHDRIGKEEAKVLNVDLGEEYSISGKEVFEELHKKFSCYLIRKPYYGKSFPDNLDDMPANEKRLEAQWKDVFPEDRIIRLPDADRIVDVIFGIFARETGRVDYFKDEIEDRQEPGQVNTVYKALKTVHVDVLGDSNDPPKMLKSGHSKLRGVSGGKKTKSLM